MYDTYHIFILNIEIKVCKHAGQLRIRLFSFNYPVENHTLFLHILQFIPINFKIETTRLIEGLEYVILQLH